MNAPIRNFFIAIPLGLAATLYNIPVAYAGCTGNPITLGGTEQGFGYAMAAGPDYFVIGAPRDSEHGESAGAAYVFIESNGALVLDRKITAADPEPNSYFGGAVAASGDTIIVGAYWVDDLAPFGGAGYVFRRVGNAWSQEAKLLAPDGVAQDFFGGFVALHGDVAAVTAVGQDAGANGASAVYVFRRSGTNWTYSTKLTDPQPEVGGRFGHSLAISGDWLAVGSNITDRVRMYRWDGSNWPLMTTLTAINPPPGDTGFGTALAMDADELVISSIHYVNTHEGIVFQYKLIGNSWVYQQAIEPPDHLALGHFGWNVGMSSSHLVVGAIETKRVYLYQKIDDQWRFQSSVQSPNPSNDDGFGSIVAVGGGLALAGIPDDMAISNEHGAAYAFSLTQCVTAIPAMGIIGIACLMVGLVCTGAVLARK